MDKGNENLFTISENDLRKIIREEVKAAIESYEARKKLISSQEIMSLFHVSRTTIWRWSHEGVITPVKSKGNKNLYRRSEIEKLINLQEK